MHDYDVKIPNFAFYGLSKRATTKSFMLFLFLNLDMVPRNSTQEGSPTFDKARQSKWLGIIAIKTERTQIHFLSDVLVAVASLDLKVPIRNLKRRQ